MDPSDSGKGSHGITMARVFLKKTLSGFAVAEDTESQGNARKFKVGVTYKAEIVRPRSLKTLGRYWVLIDMILENTEMFPSKEALHAYLKIRAGHVITIVAKSSGEITYLADSIDFDTLDETEFQKVWSRVCDIVAEDILPGVTVAEIELEISKLIGIAT